MAGIKKPTLLKAKLVSLSLHRKSYLRFIPVVTGYYKKTLILLVKRKRKFMQDVLRLNRARLTGIISAGCVRNTLLIVINEYI